MKKFFKIIKLIIIAILIFLVGGVFLTKCNTCKKQNKSLVAYAEEGEILSVRKDLNFNGNISTIPFYKFESDSSKDYSSTLLLAGITGRNTIEVTNVPSNITLSLYIYTGGQYIFQSDFNSVGNNIFYVTHTYPALYHVIFFNTTSTTAVTFSINLYFYAGEYVPGYGQGLAAGLQQGKEEGYKEGYKEGKSDGYDEGYEEGYSDGYGEGYDNSNELKIYSTATTNNVSGLSWGNPNSTYSTVSAEGSALRVSNRDYIRNQFYNEPYARWELPFTWEANREFVLKYDDLKSYYINVELNNQVIQLINTLHLILFDDTDKKVTDVYLGQNSPNTWEQSFKYNSTIRYINFYSTCTYFDITNFQFGAYGGDEYQVGYDTGYNKGFNEGETTGYDNGYEAGETQGDTTGYNRGLTEGKAEGYEQALSEGVSQMGLFNGAVSFVKMFFTLTTQFLETKIAGDITLGLIVIGLPAAFMIVNLAMGLVKKFLGGRGASEGDDGG